jgi:hypothetical protein
MEGLKQSFLLKIILNSYKNYLNQTKESDITWDEKA